MVQFFLKRLKGRNYENKVFRTKTGITAAILGLVSNALLFGGKIAVGLISGSVSIMADAVNNLSDTASSLITLIGFRIAGKPADNEHPYGHERFESISGLMVSILIIYVGFQFLHTSYDKIIEPADLSLNAAVFFVLVLSILIKIWQSRMYYSLGREIHSETLKVTGKDSLNDVIVTMAVLFSAGVEYFSGWRIDGYAGLVIALYIMYSGITMIKDFIDELMGSRPTPEDIKAMEDMLSSYPCIFGFHDLLVHSYGPNMRFASVHIEVDESWSLKDAHYVIESIERDFREHLQVDMVCHLDPVAVNDSHYMAVYHGLQAIVANLKLNLRMHDFRLEDETKTLKFEIVIPQKCPMTDEEILDRLSEKIRQTIGNYEVHVVFDHNYLL